MRQVTSYSRTIKEGVLAKVLGSSASNVVELAKEFNIPYSTIYAWKNAMLKKQHKKHVNAPQRPNDKSPEVKLQAVIDTAGKTEIEQAAYCREHGIYTHQLDEWKQRFLDGFQTTPNKRDKVESQHTAKEVKQLKRDLHRKDKALAEVSALLILKKKADLLWGVEEDV